MSKIRKTVKVRVWGGLFKAYYEDGKFYAWDDVAECYTTCHSLSPWQEFKVMTKADRTTPKPAAN